ncbi:hypothetical protein RP20_CCG022406 [Aedes albopictus]|nr:hypothetical protein RP20_CCG022406 [Aedes albopictus]
MIAFPRLGPLAFITILVFPIISIEARPMCCSACCCCGCGNTVEAPVEEKEEPGDNMRSGLLAAMMQSNQTTAGTMEGDPESPAANARFFGWLFDWYDDDSSEEDDKKYKKYVGEKNIVYMQLVDSTATINMNK